ncbi:GGDEF domain-containing protein [Massilia litorea]|uniref:diguanylate cyclase n=1 Tax=Massilia litorea TaxID=2769491 RepID=A0A7L9TYC0_9BURK|nr:GGDEF domain-containing protein [Massilia litorea]QOL47784.1 GGDEF domain-containing protein [Massilia litorea]
MKAQSGHAHQLDAAQLRRLLTLSRELLQTDEAGVSLGLIGQALSELIQPDASLLLLRAGGLDIVEFDNQGRVRAAGKDHPLFETGMLLLPDIDAGARRAPPAPQQCQRVGLRTLALAIPAYAAVAILVASWNRDLASAELERYENTIVALLELGAAALGKIEARSSLERLVDHQRRQMATTSASHAAELARRDDVAVALNTLSLTDVLTGLYNRRGFFVQAEHLHKVSRRRRAKSAVIFADIDGLKRVNDELGHDRGDAAIRDAAFVFRQSFRQADVVSRLGGDEFVAYTLDDEQPGVVLERIQANLDAFNLTEERPYVLSLSAGIVQCDPASDETLSDYLLRADERMYANKRSRLH